MSLVNLEHVIKLEKEKHRSIFIFNFGHVSLLTEYVNMNGDTRTQIIAF